MTALKNRPSEMDVETFVGIFGGIYEHSPWVAERAWTKIETSDFDHVEALATLMAAIVAEATDAEKLALIKAHPDLAGKAAVQGELTHSSTSEQESAGLNECTAEEFEQFQAYNHAYKSKFGFPFIKAVKNSNRHEILAGFEERLKNDPQTEFNAALQEIDKIAGFRLQEL
ncbi:2-oxo-4-hydroxy-4-carboxy-5-ureidoimidazoline decarboxylase [Sneathiella sp.]|jgi:2-oxo-4-hydroxy-4-carboxy-5-ureidoimidazoline decarboxylase|uniref:2-oxo-4-hydroxy-4-carboxy-5-ureidoimidazoline decarboxylase n=1 Tax=Sneathiella sp. TaxID=1964365 RepID=UPI0039E557E8